MNAEKLKQWIKDSEIKRNQSLDELKQMGWSVYRCNSCNFRGRGAAVTYHELKYQTHKCANEDTMKELSHE